MHIKYEPLTDHDISNIAVVQVHSISTKIHPAPKGSLHDLRMGAMRNLKCGTCSKNEESCPGHFGYIQLHTRILNPIMIKTTFRDLIQSMCFTCFRKDEECTCSITETNNKKRKIAQPTKITPVKKSKTQYEYSDKKIIEPEEIYQILKKNQVPFDESMFLTRILVLPNTARPPEMNTKKGTWSAHPTTILYMNILRAKKTVDELQNAVNMLFDVENTNVPVYNASAIATGGMRQRLDGKTGRLRLNMMGKRTNFSARTVLSGDPTLGINEIGVPKRICETLTVPVRITHLNIQSISIDSIKYIIKNKIRYDFKIARDQMKIQVGDIIERNLQSGDIVAVNRQPTLHRGSMMACRVRESPKNILTFGLNYTTMIPLNADTDGDEINIHVPQTIEAAIELEELMMASSNIVSSQSSKPLMGCTQDSLLGLYLLSKNKHVPDMQDILYDAYIDSVEVDNHRGIDTMTYILQHLRIQNMTVHIPKSNFSCIQSVIQDGAIFDKPVVGNADGSMIHAVYLSYGHFVAAQFIHALQRVAIAYLNRYGATIGPGDCYIPVDKIHHQALNDYIQSELVTKGTLPDENELVDTLNIVTRRTDILANTENNLTNIIKAGSKGSMVNFNQITQSVGQQIINSGRPIQLDRNLPHFTKFDYGLYARGFITNSFIQGMNPTELFFHAMSGRVGIIDTGIKTADTGAQSRRLIKCTEDLIVNDAGDGARPVMNRVTGNLIQFEYGEGDLFDGTFLHK